MPLTVKIFTKHGGRPTLFQTREFEDLPITIGRDAGCTVALDDPLKHISRVHVELEEADGTYWMSVVSKVNPVLVKGRRYGPGTRLTLNSGDSFEMGEFEVQVEFAEPPPAPAPIETAPTADIPPPEPGIFDEPTFVGGHEPTYMGPAVKIPPLPSAPEATKPPRPVERRPGPDVTAPVPVGASMTVALRAFLDGAGLPQKDCSPAEAERLLRDSGAILRAAIEGLMMLLIARAEMRKEFQAEERTMVAQRDNNPLKLMSDASEAMTFIFDPPERSGGFLEPVQAIGDACEDLRAHELALMSGMRAAILGALRKLDPQALERTLEKAGGFSLAGRKARLWDLYLAQQEKLSQEAREDFNKVFGRDFMSAYQAQLRKLKTGG